jgi:hypothetical protein
VVAKCLNTIYVPGNLDHSFIWL